MLRLKLRDRRMVGKRAFFLAAIAIFMHLSQPVHSDTYGLNRSAKEAIDRALEDFSSSGTLPELPLIKRSERQSDTDREVTKLRSEQSSRYKTNSAPTALLWVALAGGRSNALDHYYLAFSAYLSLVTAPPPVRVALAEGARRHLEYAASKLATESRISETPGSCGAVSPYLCPVRDLRHEIESLRASIDEKMVALADPVRARAIYDASSTMSAILKEIPDIQQKGRRLRAVSNDRLTAAAIGRFKESVTDLESKWKGIASLAAEVNPDDATQIESGLVSLQSDYAEAESGYREYIKQRLQDASTQAIDETMVDELVFLSSENEKLGRPVPTPLIGAICEGSASTQCASIASNTGLSLWKPSRGQDPTFIIVLSVKEAQTNRRVVDTESQWGRFASAPIVSTNPLYQAALMEAMIARAALGSAVNSAVVAAAYTPPDFAGGFATGLAAVNAVFARKHANAAEARLRATSPYQSSVSYTDYRFEVETVEATYIQRVGVALIDRKARQAKLWSIPISRSKVFFVADGVHPNDPVAATFDSNADVATWLNQQPWQIDLRGLSDGETVKTIPLRSALTDEVVAEALRAFTGLRARSGPVDAPVRADPRMSAVVVIDAGGTLGAGFYVDRYYVLTNAHVVQGRSSVAARTYLGKSEQMAKVVEVDTDRDLALLRVTDGHSPARIWPSGMALPIGQPIIAIGHPKGLEFSVSSGVISGVRDLREGGATLRLIQSDAALNPGNSGGPLFLGESVIGIVTSKHAGAEGLAFAVHADEIRRFLESAFLF